MSVRPFTEERHDRLADKVRALVGPIEDAASDADAAGVLADGGLLALCVPGLFGGAADKVSPLALVIAREILAGARAACDAALAVQALVALPIAWVGTKEQQKRWLPALASGGARGAFALTEAESGSDVGALATAATREADGYRLDGEKVLISGAAAATVFVVFARTSPGERRVVSAFIVPRETPGISVVEIASLGEHALGRVRLDGVRVPTVARLGDEGGGVALALRTLELMRPTVGAAACGMAARALAETRALVRERRRGGTPLFERESVRMKLGEMATDLEAARLLVYRAAWLPALETTQTPERRASG